MTFVEQAFGANVNDDSKGLTLNHLGGGCLRPHMGSIDQTGKSFRTSHSALAGARNPKPILVAEAQFCRKSSDVMRGRIWLRRSSKVCVMVAVSARAHGGQDCDLRQDLVLLRLDAAAAAA